jgi:hypothetical protein
MFFDDSFAPPEDLDAEFPAEAAVADDSPPEALFDPAEPVVEQVPPAEAVDDSPPEVLFDSAAPVAEEVPPADAGAPAPRPVVRPLAPRPRPSRLRSIPWTWLGVYGTIVVSLIALGVAAIVAYNEFADQGPRLDQTARSSALGIALDYPAGWSAASGAAALLSSAPQVTLTLADRPIQAASGPYTDATLVIAVQSINPIAVFGVPGLCRSQIAGGPEATFACMQRNGYLTPVHQPFKTSRYQGLTLPGTLPPSAASLPMILLPADEDEWTAVIIVHWNGYPDAPQLLASVARSVRPLR